MRAVVMRAFGDESVLAVQDVDAPTPAVGEAVVRVAAVEVSRTRDLATRSGRHPFSRQVTLPHVLGGDFAGVVEATGPGVDPALVSRRVAVANSTGCGSCDACRAGEQALCPALEMLGIHRWGSYAELAAVPADNLEPIPDDVSFAAAAAMAATGPIALTQLQRGEVQRGTRMLLTGVTGALGTMLAVLAADLGAQVIGLSRRPEAIPAALALEATLRSDSESLAEQLRALAGPAGIPVTIDNVCDPEVFAAYFPVLSLGARVVISGAIAAPELPVLPVAAAPFYTRSLSLLGVRTTNRAVIAAFWARVRDGLRMPDELLHTRRLEEAAAAHAQIAHGEAVAHTILLNPLGA